LRGAAPLLGGHAIVRLVDDISLTSRDFLWYPAFEMEHLILLAAQGHKDPPLIDLDLTVLVQLAVFFVLMIALNAFVFRPFIALRREQEDSMAGARRKAEEETRDAAVRLSQYEAQILAARKEAAGGRVAQRAEGQAVAEKKLSVARSTAEARIAAAKEQLERNVPAVQLALRTRANELARAVAGKLLGRQV
jgi:F-type H+-transporting ATPase subunit b